MAASDMAKKPTVLVIAGSDSSSGAGIQADNKVLETFKVNSLNIVTASSLF